MGNSKENAERRVFPNPNRSRGNSRQVIQKTDGNVVRVWNSIRITGDTQKIAFRHVVKN
jgi:hypothetical protein